ncbi:MAG: sulfatase-like hydrolase/transferase, partial [Chloroflexota bacterium]
MKAIMVMFDSLNRHMLPPYGCDWVHAPNFQRLAEKSVTFDNSYVGSMPCMPARRELHTGRYNFLHRSWGPLEPFDDSMPEILKNHDIYTHFITDHQHYWEDGGCTYHNRYNSYEFVRGQEGDLWKGHVEPPIEIPPFERGSGSDPSGKMSERMWHHDWINRTYMTTPEEQPQPQTFQLGVDFMRANHQADNWYLQIETFDPHEPFFSHQKHKDHYPHDYDGPHFDWPNYGRVTEPPEQVK